MAPFRPRPKQQEVLDYAGGKMGVSAVPGSGKTHTLALLAGHIVASGALADDQEVLIVTLVNSAVDVFAARVARYIQEQGLLPNVGYRVRTLHGLAHDIVRERPGLVGLADGFTIVDERLATQMLQDALETWMRSHPEALDDYLAPELDGHRREWVRRDCWPEELFAVAVALIRQAKDDEMTPAELGDRLDRLRPQPLPLVEMVHEIYADYQRALAYRGAVDFDDLIRLALQVLRLDPAYLERLRYRWPYILEDEAQDSSRLQEEILRLLAGTDGNWVRVGDPNQAIYETFTTANPDHLRRFLAEPGVEPRELPDSGRSTPSIIRTANFLIQWTTTAHPVGALRGALSPPYILPTPPGDPQPNPPDDPQGIVLVPRKYSPSEELDAVVASLGRWLPEHPDWTVAALVPRNQRGSELVARLRAARLPCLELLRTARATREAAGVLGNVLAYLADPASPAKLATLYRVWRRGERDDPEAKAALESAARALRACRQVEDFLWPRAGRDWLAELARDEARPALCARLEEFRTLVQRWHGAALLPVDQLILTVAQDLFHEPAELALAHRLAGLLERAAAAHPHWQLAELADELAVIARDRRRFIGLSDDESGFDPDAHKGEVVVTTVHKAKGLEWDRVYLISVNNYDFPSAQAQDTYIGEPWFVRDRLNLQAEALAQLAALRAQGEDGLYEEGAATRQARLDYAAERLRLFYVGITRARRELIISWNTGRRADRQPSVPFLALRTFWEEHQSATGARDQGESP